VGRCEGAGGLCRGGEEGEAEEGHKAVGSEVSTSRLPAKQRYAPRPRQRPWPRVHRWHPFMGLRLPFSRRRCQVAGWLSELE